MRFFSLYQYVAPAVLFPLAYTLFLARCHGDHAAALFMLTLPIAFSYVIPALGMNWLKLWAMRTRLRIGRIRPHHGLVFGSASSVFALVALEPLREPLTTLGVLRAALVLGSVIGFWNWLYDAVAIRVGFIQVFNRPWWLGQSAEAIATDYAPVVFGGFGAAYGAWMRVAEEVLLREGRRDLFAPLLVAALATSLALPVLAFIAQSFWLHGESGLTTYEGRPPPPPDPAGMERRSTSP